MSEPERIEWIVKRGPSPRTFGNGFSISTLGGHLMAFLPFLKGQQAAAERAAHLMGASPELSAALQAYRDFVRLLPSDCVPWELRSKLTLIDSDALAALRKAAGGRPT